MESNYTKVPNHFIKLVEKGKLSGLEMRLFLFIASRINHRTRDCKLNTATIVELMGVAREWVTKARSKLKKEGLLNYMRTGKSVMIYQILNKKSPKIHNAINPDHQDPDDIFNGE